MNHYFMLCVILPWVIFSVHASAQEKLETLPSEEFPTSYLYYKIKRLEEKDVEMEKMIDEKDDEIKKNIEERDEKVN